MSEHALDKGVVNCPGLTEAIDREWDAVEQKAMLYGEGFSKTFTPFFQEPLPGLDDEQVYGRSLHDKIYRERILGFTNKKSGLIGGDDEFVRSLARQAFINGLLGFNERTIQEAPVTIEEEYLSTENLENEHYSEPKPTKKNESQPGYISVFSQAELTTFVVYWYTLGCSERLLGWENLGLIKQELAEISGGAEVVE